MDHNDSDAKRKPLAILHYSPFQRDFTSSPPDPRQQLEQDMARTRRSNAPSASSFTFLSSSPAKPHERPASNIISLDGGGSSSRAYHSPTPLPSPSQRDTTVDLGLDDDETPPSPGLSPLAQHVGTLAQPLLCQLAAAAIDQDAARLEALGDVERQIELVKLNRRTTRAALEKVVLDWARKLTENGGVEGEFVEVRRAAEEFERFKFTRLVFIEERIRRDAASMSDDDTESEKDAGPGLFSSIEPQDNDADDSDWDHARITLLRPPFRRVPHRKSTTASSQPAELTHYSPNVYADDSIPSYLKYFVLGRYQHITLPPPPTAFSRFHASTTTNSSSTIASSTPTIINRTIDQNARFPLHIPNRARGRTDIVHLPVNLAAAEDWESKHWVWDLNRWHMAQLNARRFQPARHVRHKWNRNEKEWLRAWVEERTATTVAAEDEKGGEDGTTKKERVAGDDGDKKEEGEEQDVDAVLTREWNDYAVTTKGWQKGFRRRDRVILREARRKLAKTDA